MNQSTNIPLFQLDQDFNFNEIFSYDFIDFKKDWYGNPLSFHASFFLGATKGKIFFAFKCHKEAFIDESHKKDEFIEGLWKFDVAEIFILDTISRKYQEFNLSPAGSWWSMLFSKYRKEDRMNFKKPEDISTLSSINKNSWQSAISIPIQSLSFKEKKLDSFKLNISSILYQPEAKYLSWAKINSEKPDFHRSEYFINFSPKTYKKIKNI